MNFILIMKEYLLNINIYFQFKTEKKVTLTLSTGENEEKKLSLDHLQVFFDKLSIVGTKIKEAHFSQKMINRKYQGKN